MFNVNVRMALAALKGAKIRTFLTMLGIIIGVASVVAIVALGEGLKKAVNDEVSRFGNDIVQINPGESIIRNDQGEIEEFNFGALFGADPLTEKDLQSVQQTSGVRVAVPLSLISGTLTSGDVVVKGATAIGTSPEYPEIIQLGVDNGGFFNNDQLERSIAVLGPGIAQKLYGESNALGRKFSLRGEEFTVIGVMEEYESVLSGSFGSGGDPNQMFYIPIKKAIEINQGLTLIQEIDFRVNDVDQIDSVIGSVTEALKANRGGEMNFTVSKPEEFLDLTNEILSQVTLGVSAIAAISVLVGGIGIMNIMFVTVSERTKEIGVRKAIGATPRQIRSQFLIEAMVLSLLGALIGLGFAFIGITLTTLLSDFTPVLKPMVVLYSMLGSVFVGVVSGFVPAIKAARKDPIESLRHD